MCSSSLRRMSDDSNGSQPLPAGAEKEERSGENAGDPDNPAPGNGESFPATKPDSGGATDADDGREAGDETEKQVATTEDDDDEDGFRTPTSLEHRIPAITECPPAPRKPPPSRWKRRRSPPPLICRCLEFDASEEVEPIMWPETNGEEDGGDEPESKRARIGADGDEDEGRC